MTWNEYIYQIAKDLGVHGNCCADSIRMKDVVQNPSLYVNLIEKKRILESKRKKGDLNESI